MFVDSEYSVRCCLFVSFFEEFFSFEHDGEDVASVFGVFMVFFDESGEELFSGFFGDGFFLVFCG